MVVEKGRQRSTTGRVFADETFVERPGGMLDEMFDGLLGKLNLSWLWDLP